MIVIECSPVGVGVRTSLRGRCTRCVPVSPQLCTIRYNVIFIKNGHYGLLEFKLSTDGRCARGEDMRHF